MLCRQTSEEKSSGEPQTTIQEQKQKKDSHSTTNMLGRVFRTHFIQYEGGRNYSNEPVLACGDGSTYCSDMICPMYHGPWDIEGAGRKQPLLEDSLPNYDPAMMKPIIQCEFSHAWGNSCGSVHKFFDLYYDERFPGIQGGFVWEWADAELSVPDDLHQLYETAGRACIQDYVENISSGGLASWSRVFTQQEDESDKLINKALSSVLGPGVRLVNDEHQLDPDHDCAEVEQVKLVDEQNQKSTSKVQSASATAKRPAKFYYGGDFGPTSGFQDNSFIADGLLHADRARVHPTYMELRALQQPVFFSPLPVLEQEDSPCPTCPASCSTTSTTMRLRIQNRFDFSTLGHVQFFAEYSGTSRLLQCANPQVLPKRWTTIEVPKQIGIEIDVSQSQGPYQKLSRVYAIYQENHYDQVRRRAYMTLGLAPMDVILGEWFPTPLALLGGHKGGAEYSSSSAAAGGVTAVDVVQEHGKKCLENLIKQEMTGVEQEVVASSTAEGGWRSKIVFDVPGAGRRPQDSSSSSAHPIIKLPIATTSILQNVGLASGTSTSTARSSCMIESIEYNFVRAPIENDRGGMDVELVVGGRALARRIGYLPSGLAKLWHNQFSHVWLWTFVYKLFEGRRWTSTTARNEQGSASGTAEKNNYRFIPNIYYPKDYYSSNHAASSNAAKAKTDEDYPANKTSFAAGGFSLKSVEVVTEKDQQQITGATPASSSTSPSANISKYVLQHDSRLLGVQTKTEVFTSTSCTPLEDLQLQQPDGPQGAAQSVFLSCTVDCRRCVTSYLPRVGIRLCLSGRHEKYSYYGQGPYENYCDRGRASCHLGLFENENARAMCPYAKPQEYNGRADAQWVFFTTKSQKLAIRIFDMKCSSSPEQKQKELKKMEAPASSKNKELSTLAPVAEIRPLLTVTPCSIEQLTTTEHAHELRDEGKTWVCFDVSHIGIAGAGGLGSVWGTDPMCNPLPEKRIWSWKIEIRFIP
ncbi:unnamed protein product [Amoebophrya sp. A25]|nr:unnamed protein product [Amoebophrya sp. A25]|eukprot:GSA25T00005516001.1